MMETRIFTQEAVAAQRMGKSSIEVCTQAARAAASPLQAPVDATNVMQVVHKGVTTRTTRRKAVTPGHEGVTMHTMRRKAVTPGFKAATPGSAAARTALVWVTPLAFWFFCPSS